MSIRMHFLLCFNDSSVALLRFWSMPWPKHKQFLRGRLTPRKVSSTFMVFRVSVLIWTEHSMSRPACASMRQPWRMACLSANSRGPRAFGGVHTPCRATGMYATNDATHVKHFNFVFEQHGHDDPSVRRLHTPNRFFF